MMPHRPLTLGLFGLFCGLSLMVGLPAAQAGPDLATTRVASGLTYPTTITHAPGDESRLFILEKPGRIRILNLDTGTLNPTPFLDITSIVNGGTTFGNEQGLLGLAFHPNYDENGYFYVNYVAGTFSGSTVVRRYTVSEANPDVANLASGVTIIQYNQTQTNHNGGWLGFGPDGFLYISSGDGGGAGDTPNNAQTTSNLLGNLLRIDVDNPDEGLNYGIPKDNPFHDTPGSAREEIWAFGLRNPWRCSFDRQTGDLWIGDVGQNVWEEINVQPADSTGRENYGWRCYEGFATFNTTGCPPQSSLKFPILMYQISGQPECAITGGYVYRGCDIPSLQGMYIYADFCSAKVWLLDPNDPNLPYNPQQGGTNPAMNVTSQISPSQEGFSVTSIASFGEDARGELYIAKHSPGEIYKIIPETAEPNPDLNCDGVVNVSDLLVLLGQFGDCPDGGSCPADLNGDGTVNVSDLLLLLANFG